MSLWENYLWMVIYDLLEGLYQSLFKLREKDLSSILIKKDSISISKETGLGWTTLSVDDAGGTPRAIKNDITNFSFATPRGIQDVTGVDKSAMERLLLLADFSITLNGVFNDAGDASFDVFSTVPSTSVVRTVSLTVSGQSLPNECLFSDYALTRPADGSLTWTARGVLADGTVPTWA